MAQKFPITQRTAGLGILAVLVLGFFVFALVRGQKVPAPENQPVSVAAQEVPELVSPPAPEVPDAAEELEAPPSEDKEEGEKSQAEGSGLPDSQAPSTPSTGGFGEKDAESFGALFKKVKAYDPPESFPLGLVLSSTSGRVLKFQDFRGGWLVVNFWASWCAPCVKELPAFSALARKFQNSKVQMVAVSLDTKLDSKGVEAFVQEKALGEAALYVDPEGVIQKTLSLEGLPVTLVVDPAGKILWRLDGEGKWEAPAAERFLALLSKI